MSVLPQISDGVLRFICSRAAEYFIHHKLYSTQWADHVNKEKTSG